MYVHLLPKKVSTLVLTSGGLDSTTVLYMAKARTPNVTALHIKYGQRHSIESWCLRYHVQRLNIPLYTLTLPIWTCEDTSLVGTSRNVEQVEYSNAPMSTYVPARNTVFAAVAMSYMEKLKIPYLGLGIHPTETYPDTKPAWASAMSLVLRHGLSFLQDASPVHITNGGGVWMPFAKGTKTDIVRAAFALHVPMELTWSCYSPVCTKIHHMDVTRFEPCGKCATCRDRASAFAAVKKKDPLHHITVTNDSLEAAEEIQT